MLKRKQITIAITLLAGLAGASLSSAVGATQLDGSSAVIAKRGGGKDDATGDDRGTHGAGHPKSEQVFELAKRGRGKDDAAGDDRGTHGAGHPRSEQVIELAKRGKDDAAGDDRGTHGAGHPKADPVIELARRGADDAAGGGRREDRRADRRQA